MRPILLLFVLLTASLAALVVGSDIHEWEEYKTQFEKKYNSPLEDDKRKAIHGIRKKEVDAHNRLYHRGERSYMQGINQFTDLTLEELQHYTGFRALQVEFNSGPSFEKIHQRSGKPLPISVDWRKKNVVTPVKNQGRCSSCWAFSATGSMEGQHSLKEGKLVSLSEKQLMDCIPEHYGCKIGGLMTDAFSYVIKNGIEGESDYPYVPHNGTCIFNSREIRAKFSNYKQITPGDENALEDAVATVGPISVAIGSELISSYTTGIFDNPDCNRFERDHAVLIVGYGVEGDTPYWIVKNSWGEKWGEGGYLRIVRGKNMCGITEFATYPVV